MAESFAELSKRWDERYGASPHVWRAEADETLREVVATMDPGRAVDLGAGEGRNALWLAEQGWSVTAVDSSRIGLDRLEDEAVERHVEVQTIVQDLTEFLQDASSDGTTFDLIVVAYIHAEEPIRDAMFARAVDVLAPGGILFIVGHHKSSLGISGPPVLELLYDEDDLRGAIDDLEVVRLEERKGKSDLDTEATDVLVVARRSDAG